MPSSARVATQRLNPHVRPSFYDVQLKVDLATGTFSGEETVAVKVDEATSQLALHALDLQIKQADTSIETGATPVKIIGMNMSRQQEMVAFTTDKPLAPGEYKLRTKFSGKLSDKLVGLYKANFVDRNGKTQMFACTQFEAADARRMIPCFDEPDMKARFKLTVTVDSKFNAVSNSPQIKETTRGTEKTIEFDATPPMSSYLLALAIGELEATPPLVVQGTPIRVWSAKGMAHLGKYARDEAGKLLPFMNQYFGIPYPWKKLDLVAVPEFAAGAMENPGCITFRETLLLIDPKTASTGSQKSATGVIAHEMAHLWFGDLVTMKWWDDLWLNEAFATWMATKATDAAHPEWEEWKFYAAERAHGMSVDSLHSTRTIHYEVKSPDQTHEMFDAITYQKGAAVLRMLERYVAEPVFRKGVQLYLKAHEFGNATTNDLWDGIAQASGQPVREMMHSWVYQPGYPIIAVGESAGTTPQITLEQRRFYLDSTHPQTNEKWMVPVGLRAIDKPAEQSGQSEAQTKFLLQEKNSSVSTTFAGQPLIANAGGVGFYRTRYDDALYNRILAQPRTHLDPSERVALIGDTSALMTSGAIPVTRALDLIAHYKGETDESVWGALLADVAYFDRYIDSKTRPAYQKFVRDELSQIFARLTWNVKPTDSAQTRQLRGRVIGLLGTIGQDKAVIAEARKRFAQYLANKNSLDRDLVGPVSSTVAYNGTAADYARFRQLSLKAATPEERVRNLYMLADFRSPALADQTLNYAISKQVRLQDAPGLVSGLISSREVQDQSWRFVKTNWAKIRAFFPEEMMPHLVTAAGSFSYPNQLADLKSFIATHPLPTGKISSARTIERASINVQFRNRSSAELNKWMQSHFGG